MEINPSEENEINKRLTVTIENSNFHSNYG